MAKKNEILLSIALEGDQDVKSKLKAVGDAGDASLKDLSKTLGDAKSGLGGIGESAGKVKEALAPLTEAGGLAGLANLGGISGILSRFSAGLLSPAGLVAGITGALLGMAKLGDETQRQKDRLKGLGDDQGFGKLTDQAKQLGTHVSDLQPRYEKFIAYQQKLTSENQSVIHPPGFVPGAAEEAAAGVRVVGGTPGGSPPSRDAFQAFDRALFEEIRRDVGNNDDAHRLTGQFEDNLYQKGLTGDALRTLQQTSSNAANFVTNSLSQRLGRGFANPNELATALDRGQVNVSAPDLIREGASHAADADKEAAAARGVTDALGALEASAKRLAEAFGGDSAGLTKGIDSIARVIDGAAETIDRQLHAKDYQPGGSKFIGPVRPEDVQTAPKSLGEVYSSDQGDFLGRLVGYLRNTAATGTGTGPAEITGGNPFGVITDFTRKAVTNPGALTERPRPDEQPIIGPVPPGGDTNPAYNWPTAPIQPQAPQRLGEAAPLQQTADLSGIITRILEGVSAAANNLNKPNLNVDEPATGGIRGEAQSGTATADASQSITAAGDKLAAALDGVTALISSVQQGSPVKVQAAAGGGLMRRWFDGGGGVSGPGTSTSDSIPAMLSDGEYVIKASSAQKLGRSTLDWLNSGAPGLAHGGDVSERRLAAVRRLADGGDASGDGVVSQTLASQNTLSRGSHSIVFDPITGGAFIDGVLHLPGDPILNDPAVRQAIAQSKAGMSAAPSTRKYKSDFVGRFGHSDDSDTYVASGGPIGGSWLGLAGGGQVSLAPMLHHLADGGDAGAPALDGAALAAPSSGSMGHFDVDLRTNHGDFKMRADEDVARQLTRAAGDSTLAQTGNRPSWYYGQGR